MSRKRCRCHPRDAYATCVECPQCHHWSLDPWVNMCERRRCAYVGPLPGPELTEVLKQQTLDLR